MITSSEKVAFKMLRQIVLGSEKPIPDHIIVDLKFAGYGHGLLLICAGVGEKVIDGYGAGTLACQRKKSR